MDSLENFNNQPLLKWTKIELEETEDESPITDSKDLVLKRKDSCFTDTPTSVSSIPESISRVFGKGVRGRVRQISVEQAKTAKIMDSSTNSLGSVTSGSGSRDSNSSNSSSLIVVKREEKGKSYRKYSNEQSSRDSEKSSRKIYWLQSNSDCDGLDSTMGEGHFASREGNIRIIDNCSKFSNSCESTTSADSALDTSRDPSTDGSNIDHETEKAPMYQNVRDISKTHLIEKWIRSQSNCSKKAQKGCKIKRIESRETNATTCISSSILSSEQSSPTSEPISCLPAEYSCAICRDVYRDPRYLPCGHTYCKGCISSIVSSSSHDSKQKKCFTCPSCRNIIKYGQDGIKALPRNRNIESAIKRFKKLPDKVESLCTKHNEKHGPRAKTIWCETCNESICNLCAQSQRHRHHVTMPLDTMKQFQIIRKKLSKTKTELKSKSVGLKTSIDGIEKTRDKLDSKKSEIKKKIDAECDSMIEMIEKQRKQMYSQMDNLIAKKQKRKQREIANISSDLNNTKSMLRTINDILETEEPRSFLHKLKASSLSTDFSVTSPILV